VAGDDVSNSLSNGRLLYVLTWTVPRHVTQTQYSAVCIQWKLSAVIHSGKNWALGGAY